MPSKVYSAAVVGVEAFEVEIEVHAGWGNTDKIAGVGLPDTAVKESKDRVTSAICNSGLRWPYGKRITINLAPADVRKEGPSFDLPIAVAMQAAESQIAWLRKTLAVGSRHLATTRRPGERVYASRWYDKAVIFLAMASLRVATTLAGYFHAASLAELEENQMMIVHGADRPVLLCRHEGRVFALDNRSINF
jgi:hypothetical protein